VTPDLPTCRTYFQQLLTVQPVQREIDHELAAPFTMMELETALAKMKDGAAPGEDGTPQKPTNMVAMMSKTSYYR